jgi:hypothetical protein
MRPSPSGPPAWLQVFDTAPNSPSRKDTAMRVVLAVSGCSGFFLRSSAAPMSIHSGSRAMAIS